MSMKSHALFSTFWKLMKFTRILHLSCVRSIRPTVSILIQGGWNKNTLMIKYFELLWRNVKKTWTSWCHKYLRSEIYTSSMFCDPKMNKMQSNVKEQCLAIHHFPGFSFCYIDIKVRIPPLQLRLSAWHPAADVVDTAGRNGAPGGRGTTETGSNRVDVPSFCQCVSYDSLFT